MASGNHRVELCMITTPDGIIDVNGRSGALGGPADQAQLLRLRDGASVVLVGAGTARAENYRPPSRKDLQIAVVTKSCTLDFNSALFTSGAGMIATTLKAPEVPVHSIRAGTDTVDLPGIIAQLPHGIVHVEGGPQLNGALLNADCVDAIHLTWSPHLGGFRGPSISTAPHIARRFSLVSLRHEDEFVFARYERITSEN